MTVHLPVLDSVTDLPVVDPRCIADLGEDLDSSAGAHAFLSSYLEMLQDRLSTVSTAVCAADGDSAMDRALSLKVTSTMVGALQLAALAETMEALICRGDWAAAEPLLDLLAPAVAAVRTAGAVVVNGLLHP